MGARLADFGDHVDRPVSIAEINLVVAGDLRIGKPVVLA
jgi:hypothetical protein